MEALEKKTPSAIVAEAIMASRAATPIDQRDAEGSLRVYHRVPRGGVKRWTGIVANLLRRAPPELGLHFCQQFFIIEDRLRYAWNLQVEWPGEVSGDAVASLVASLLQEGLQAVPGVRGMQLDRIPLNAPPDRNKPEGAHNPLAPGPSRGGPSQKGAHIKKAEA